ncbi:MAG: thiamine pyrophosphate-binding protein [Deltaproteobacteria bacterium]|nr:thiamine pyrophosphate-binding protein [Deltaproteobacteria bacterium]
MNRYDCLRLLGPKITDELIVTNLGGVAREWFQLKDREGNLYQPYLGHATPLALGLALALPHRPVLCLDGDGSMLLSLTVLPVIASQNPPNLKVIVFDNEAYEATGGLPTLTRSGTDLAAMAKGAGIRFVRSVTSLEKFEEAVDEAYASPCACFVAAKVEIMTRRFPYPALFGAENRFRFVRHIEKTECIQVMKPPAKALPQDKMVEIEGAE